jgi:hypothetical protein
VGCKWEWKRVEVRVPQPFLSRAAELLDALAAHPEKFFELKTSERLFVLYHLASMPVEDLLSKHGGLVEHIAQRDSELFILLLGMMDTERRLAMAWSKPALMKMAAMTIKTYL